MFTRPSFFTICDPSKTLTYVSSDVTEVLGWNSNEMEGDAFWNYTHPKDQVNLFKASLAHVAGDIGMLICIHRYRKKDGKFIWVKTRSFRHYTNIIAFTEKLNFFEYFYWMIRDALHCAPKNALIGTSTKMLGTKLI